MVWNYILVRQGEFFLKGKNRTIFEKKLLENVTKKSGLKHLQKVQGRLILSHFPNHSCLKNVFGLISYSPAIKCTGFSASNGWSLFETQKNLAFIKETALQLVKSKQGTFKVKTKRSDKTFPIKSPQLNAFIGSYIEEKSNLFFKMENPDHTIHIEINQKGVYIFTEIIPCFGGMPSGVEGQVLLLVEDKTSILAGILMMKRGTEILPVSLSGKKDLSYLNKFSPRELVLQEFNSYRELENYAFNKKIEVLVTGQQVDNFEKSATNLITFRPLVAYSKEEIKNKLNYYTKKARKPLALANG